MASFSLNRLRGVSLKWPIPFVKLLMQSMGTFSDFFSSIWKAERQVFFERCSRAATVKPPLPDLADTAR